MSISPEIQEKIDALPFDYMKEGVTRILNGPTRIQGTDEEVFKAALNEYMKSREISPAESAAREQKWRKDQVASFVEYFKREAPEKYDEYLYQERKWRQISYELGFGVLPALMKQWLPGIDDDDCSGLFSRVRDYIQDQLKRGLA